jgi:hypothetical protein
MKTKLLSSTKKYLEGCIVKHTTNLQTFLDNSLELSEDLDIIKKIQVELKQISKYKNQLNVLEEYILSPSFHENVNNEKNIEETSLNTNFETPLKDSWGEASSTPPEVPTKHSWGEFQHNESHKKINFEENIHLVGDKPQWVIDIESLS